MKSDTNWTNRSITSLIVVGISSVLGILLFEIVLRLAVSNDPWAKTREANIIRNIQFTYDIGDLYPSTTVGADYLRNEYGLRDNCEAPSDIDILTIGGSTTDQRYIPFDSTFQTILQKRLLAHFDDFGCVSNAGVDGHSTWGHIFSFKHWLPLIPQLRPKLIVLYVGVNDANFQRTGLPNLGFDTKNKDGVISFLKEFETVQMLLPVYRFLRQSSENSGLAYAGHVPTIYREDDYKINSLNEQTKSLSHQNVNAFRSRMQILLDYISTLNAIPICVTQPHRYVREKNGDLYGVPNVLGNGFSGIDYDYSLRQLNQVMIEVCGENILDLYSHPFLSAHFYDGVHTTAMGSREVGQQLAEFIISRFADKF